MAKPDTDDGWTPVAHELLAAVFCAKIPHEARAVLAIVFLQIYGPAKRRTARLDPVEVARMTGLKRPNVWRGITFLIGQGMLARGPDGGFRFVKDYERWGAAGEPLLPPGLRTFAAFAPTLAMGYRFGDDAEKAPPPAPETAPDGGAKQSIESDTQSTDADGSSVSDSIRKAYQFGYAKRISLDTRIPNREKDKENSSSSREGEGSYPYPESNPAPTAPAAVVLKPTPGGPADPAMMPPFPAADDLLEIGPGPHPVDEAEARELWRQLWLAGGRHDVCKRFYRNQRHHAPATWRRAIQEAVIRGTEVTNIGIVQVYARDVEVGRIKDTPPAERAPLPAPPQGTAPRRNAPMSAEARAKAEAKLRAHREGSN